MNLKLKRERPVLRELFIIICLFIPYVVIWLSKAVISLVWKVYAYVQSEWERFNDIYFNNTAVEKDVDPAFVASIKGADSLANPCSCNHPSASRELKKRSSNFRHRFIVFVNSVVHALLFVPEKIYAYIQRVSEDYHNIYGDSMVKLPYTEPAFIAYLKGEESAPFLYNPHVIFSKSDSRDLKNFASNSNIESRNQLQGQNGKVTEGFSLVRLVYKLYCCIRSAVSALFSRCHHLTFRDQVDGEKHYQTSQETTHPYFNEMKVQVTAKAENVYLSRQTAKWQADEASHPGTVPFSAGFAVRSDQGHLFKSSDTLRTVCNNTVRLRVPPNTGPKLKSSSLHSGAGIKQWNASQAVDIRTKTQVKLFSKGNASGEVMQPPTRRPEVNSADNVSVWESRTKTPFLFSVANEDSPAPTLPVKEIEKEKVMPSLIPTSPMPVPEPLNQEKEEVVALSNRMKYGNVCTDSEPVPSQNHDTYAVEKPIEVKHTGSGAKQAKNKKECGEIKPRKNPSSADAPVNRPTTVRFRTDFEAVANNNLVASSLAEQTIMEPQVSAVKRGKNNDGCRKDTSKKHSLIEDVHSDEFCSGDVPTDPSAIPAHSHVTSSAEEQIGMKPKVSRVKRAKNKELRRKKFREKTPSRDSRSRHFTNANVCADSQVSESQTSGKASVEEQIVEEPLISTTKRTRNAEECQQPRSLDARACINSTEHPSNMTLESSMRHAKREAESSSDAISGSKQTEFVSRQIHEVDVQKTAEQQEEMEVVDSPPETAFTELPEPMETGGEENAKIFLFAGDLSEAKAPFSGRLMEESESMETDQEESGIFSEKVEVEEMETNQASVYDEFSFAWENVMQSFLVQPVEETMEADHQELVVASPSFAKLKEIMETLQEPFQTPMPFGQVGDCNLLVAPGIATSEKIFTLPVQEEAMETQEVVDEAVKTKLGNLADAKRPLASTVGMPKEAETVLINTPAVEESWLQPVKETVAQTVKEPVLQTVQDPVLQTIKEPVLQTVQEVLQTVKEPLLQTIKDPVVQTVQEPVLQTVQEPAIPPLQERATPPPLVKTELLESTQLSVLIYSEHLQRMESKHNTEPGFATIEQQELVAVETDEIKSANQMTMEQLQLVPEDPYFPDGLDSDSDSDDSSDDEYELDLATIDEFSELHTEPEHVQLIMKLLTEKELASEQ